MWLGLIKVEVCSESYILDTTNWFCSCVIAKTMQTCRCKVYICIYQTLTRPLYIGPLVCINWMWLLLDNLYSTFHAVLLNALSTSDHWKVIFEIPICITDWFYKTLFYFYACHLINNNVWILYKWYEVISCSVLLRCATAYPSTEWLKYFNCPVNLSNTAVM